MRCCRDLDVGAIKTGMLANADIVDAVARSLRRGAPLARWWSIR